MLARSQGNPGDSGFPSDLYDIKPKGPVELVGQDNKPQQYVGLLDSGAMIGVLTHRARIGLKWKGRAQPEGLIDSETADKLQLPRSPYQGKPLKGFAAARGSDGAVPKEQVTVTWRFAYMKMGCKSVLAIYDTPNVNCIIGINGIKRSKIWINNSDVVNIRQNTEKDEIQSEIPRITGPNPLSIGELENALPTVISSSLDSPDTYPSSELSSDSSVDCRRGLLDHHPGHPQPNFALSCSESDLEPDEKSLKLLDRDLEIFHNDPLF